MNRFIKTIKVIGFKESSKTCFQSRLSQHWEYGSWKIEVVKLDTPTLIQGEKVNSFFYLSYKNGDVTITHPTKNTNDLTLLNHLFKSEIRDEKLKELGI